MLLFLYYQLSIISERPLLLYDRVINANAASSFLIRETLHRQPPVSPGTSKH